MNFWQKASISIQMVLIILYVEMPQMSVADVHMQLESFVRLRIETSHYEYSAGSGMVDKWMNKGQCKFGSVLSLHNRLH